MVQTKPSRKNQMQKNIDEIRNRTVCATIFMGLTTIFMAASLILPKSAEADPVCRGKSVILSSQTAPYISCFYSVGEALDAAKPGDAVIPEVSEITEIVNFQSPNAVTLKGITGGTQINGSITISGQGTLVVDQIAIGDANVSGYVLSTTPIPVTEEAVDFTASVTGIITSSPAGYNSEVIVYKNDIEAGRGVTQATANGPFNYGDILRVYSNIGGLIQNVTQPPVLAAPCNITVYGYYPTYSPGSTVNIRAEVTSFRNRHFTVQVENNLPGVSVASSVADQVILGGSISPAASENYLINLTAQNITEPGVGECDISLDIFVQQ